jgi:hypothetical protein
MAEAHVIEVNNRICRTVYSTFLYWHWRCCVCLSYCQFQSCTRRLRLTVVKYWESNWHRSDMCVSSCCLCFTKGYCQDQFVSFLGGCIYLLDSAMVVRTRILVRYATTNQCSVIIFAEYRMPGNWSRIEKKIWSGIRVPECGLDLARTSLKPRGIHSRQNCSFSINTRYVAERM